MASNITDHIITARLRHIKLDIERAIALIRQKPPDIPVAIDLLEGLPDDLMITYMALQTLLTDEGK